MKCHYGITKSHKPLMISRELKEFQFQMLEEVKMKKNDLQSFLDKLV